MKKYCAFDIEICAIVPEGETNWKSKRPLGISCAATLTSNGEQRLWYGGQPGTIYGDKMNLEELRGLVKYLEEAVDAGYPILTWNGMGFDFDILAEESRLFDSCRNLALQHVDMMFHFFCLKGYPLALDTAAKGMGLPGKTPGMTGDKAPLFWSQGKRQEVLSYVAQDVRTTLDLAIETEKMQRLNWISKTGKSQVAFLPDGWLPVKDANNLPEPDNSWMKEPIDRSRFTGWAR